MYPRQAVYPTQPMAAVGVDEKQQPVFAPSQPITTAVPFQAYDMHDEGKVPSRL